MADEREQRRTTGRPSRVLPEELRTRLDAAKPSAPESLRDLLDAVLAVGRGLDLPTVLRRIVETAVVLVDAEYGALGVLGEDRGLAQFLPVGVSEEEAAAIGHLPEGHGLLGELIRHPRPLRLTDLSTHPAAAGLPPGHPPMHTFLGVPIRVREEVFGNLYLTQKRAGRPFDADDEKMLSTLAVAAGVAIENADLYESTRYRQQWQEAHAEVVSRLLAGAEEDEVLRLTAVQARRILRADLGVITLPEPGGHRLRVALAVGQSADLHNGLLLPYQGSFAGAALDAGEVLLSTDIERDPRARAGPARWNGLGPVVAAPMVAGGQPRGVLLLARNKGSAPFGRTVPGPLRVYADQAALGMELGERRRAAEELGLLHDRDRIAKDLHDLAIQRLFATGMTLQSALRFVEHPAARERLLRAVDDLDETIKTIRSTVFGLRLPARGPGAQGLRARATLVVEDAARALGSAPAVRMEGLLDTDVPASVGDHVVAVLREALSNVARHAEASRVQVVLAVSGDELRLSVEDDGRGFEDPVRGGGHSGLAHMTERAQGLGGSLTHERPERGGTRLVWRVPLPPP
ncbi:GAF domain-containing protein [Streptomyces sp. SCSIO ZS0520]|uniref:sensor histidine kinase n=1 Tax=Streptomyces sp. SCSIO ZS0520 TaxID=2892996 RepID=UPI0021DAFC0F|nr:GAF domain-containing protein [Streptomyces sp. SCSIO ZS0520]